MAPSKIITDTKPKEPNNYTYGIRQYSPSVQLLAGGLGGTAGVFVTCPLEVVQTRLQSSILKIKTRATPGLRPGLATVAVPGGTSASMNVTTSFQGSIFSYMRYIAKTEGILALYKGLAPNLAGVAPTRALYFTIYTAAKQEYARILNTTLNNSIVHMLSAASASFTCSTVTNPIWFIKTRLQLDFKATGIRTGIIQLMKEVYKKEGIRGFYRGLSASYVGSVETMIYFMTYEKLKEKVAQLRGVSPEGGLNMLDYLVSAGFSKVIAACSAYPHEVVRTRLRQQLYQSDGRDVYTGFFQALSKIYIEEGRNGLYGGLSTHLLRQVPNAVIMFGTYEAVVNIMS